MARITPLDLRKQEFKQSALGLNRDQVHDFLEMVAEEMETLIREKGEIQEDLKAIQSELDKYKEIERSMNSALVMARESANQAVKAAEKESEAILAQARTDKNALLFAAKDQLNEIQNEIRDLKLKRDGFIMNFRSILRTHMEALEVEFSNDAVMDLPTPKSSVRDAPPTRTQDNEERIIDFSQSDLTISDLADEDSKATSGESEPTVETDTEKSAFEEALDFDLEEPAAEEPETDPDDDEKDGK